MCEEDRAAACAVRGTCYSAGKCSANRCLLPCWEVSSSSPPGAAPSRVPPSAPFQTTLFSFQQGPGSSVYLSCQASIQLASPYLLSLPIPFVLESLWRWLENKARSPLPCRLAAEAFPALSPLSPAASRLFV